MKLLESVRNGLRSRLSMSSRRAIAQRRLTVRSLTAQWRCHPEFLIIGAQRSGTSSLYKYLGAHPDLIPSIRKETQYFASHFDEGPSWYRAHFPLTWRVATQKQFSGHVPLSFEATPDYLFHPLAPSRVQAALPDSKLIVVLRDPADRAYSHYNHMKQLGMENLEFAEALRAEEDRIADDLALLDKNPLHRPRSALRHSYVARGKYSEQLERWMACFPRDAFLVLDFDELLAVPEDTIRTVCAFLGVRSWTPNNFPNYSKHVGPQLDKPNQKDSAKLSAETRAQVRLQYFPDLQRVTEVAGRSFSWL